MKPFARVAHASRVLVAVSHRDRLSEPRPLLEKFVALEQRDQHTRRVRYPEPPP